jgi:hypothetical protein
MAMVLEQRVQVPSLSHFPLRVGVGAEARPVSEGTVDLVEVTLTLLHNLEPLV